MRFSTDFGPKFSKFLRGRKILRSESREMIAQKSVPAVDAQSRHDPQRSPNTVPGVGMLRSVRFRAVPSGFRTEIFEKVSWPRNFAFGIVRNSVLAADAQPRNDPQRSPITVPSVGMLRRVRFHAVLNGFRTEIFEIFARPPQFCVRNRPRSRRNPCRSLTRSLATTLRGPQSLCRASA